MLTWQFSQTSGLASEAIRIFQRGWPSHVDTVMPDGTLCGARNDRVGGVFPGVQIRPPDYEKWVRVQRISVDVTAEEEAKYYAFLALQMGKPYDEAAIVAFAFNRNWRSVDHWFCSELKAACSEASWLAHPLPNVANEITPRDWLLIISPWAV